MATDAKTSPSAATAPVVKSAVRVMEIIELLTRHDQGLTFVELVELLELPKSSAHDLLRTMHERGHLTFSHSDRRYRLGVRYWEAGQAFIRGTDLAQIARPHLEAVSRDLGETVQLAILDGLDNVYIAKVDSTQPLRLVSQVGSRLPAHATGLGKALLAGLDDRELERRLAGVELEAFTDKTLTSTDALWAEIRRIRRRGYASDDGEYTPGVICTAVPVRDHVGDVVAAMSVSVPQVRAGAGARKRMVTVLQREAAALSAELGSSLP